jgi:hypothetical protein
LYDEPSVGGLDQSMKNMLAADPDFGISLISKKKTF